MVYDINYVLTKKVTFAKCEYIQHYKIWSVSIGGDTWGFEIPLTKEGGDGLANTFPYKRWEDGFNIYDLIGENVQVCINSNGKVVGLLPETCPTDDYSITLNIFM